MKFFLGFTLALGLMVGTLVPSVAGQQLAPGGKYKDCHGYMRHVSLENVRVHCIDGIPKDMSFLSWPKFVNLSNGKTMQTKFLRPGQPVHVIFTQSLGIRHAYKVYLAKPNGRGLYGFKN
ncbi:MAG: hypothetical protein M3Y21_05305 [Candidatus Eremiobacteraeota bacterium]|nr:hypothetical protein [Candidatus Eremiobacteraeota bacterium]